MSKEALFYSISGVLLICGFLLIRIGVKKTNPEEKINRTELKTDGKVEGYILSVWDLPVLYLQ
jgi:hypothetical protein